MQLTHLGEMIEALDLEIAAIQKSRRRMKCDLRNGEKLREEAGNWLYRFAPPSEIFMRDDTPVQIIAGNDKVQGTIVSFRDGMLLVNLERDLGKIVPTAQLVANDAFLLERLRDRLIEVQNGSGYFNADAAHRVVGMSPPHTGTREPPPIVVGNGDTKLNEGQIAALRKALGSDVTFVWGPPGTGKTTTLARIVEAYYREGRSVLLVSNTNIAVDTALEQISCRLYREDGFNQGLVLRRGPVVKDELRVKFGAYVILEEIATRLGAPRINERERLLHKRDRIEAEGKELSVVIEKLECHANAIRELASCTTSRRLTRKQIEEKEKEAARLRSKSAGLREDANHWQTKNAIRRFFSGVDPKRMWLEAESTDREAQGFLNAARELRRRAQEIEVKWRRMKNELEMLSKGLEEYPPIEVAQARREELRNEYKQITQQVKEIEQELATIERRILEDCRILATTAYRAYLDRAPRQFDCVVIDEASMLMPPLAFYVSGLTRNAVAVAGDFRQLAPIVASSEPKAERWLKSNVFQVVGIPEDLSRGEHPPYLCLLTEQYRMREPICTIVNTHFYDGQLKTSPGVDLRKLSFPFGTSALMHIDTAELVPWAGYRAGTRSRYNLLHAALIRNLVAHLSDKKYLPREGINEQVGVVSPYSAQATLIQALLDERLERQGAGIAATVHRFQGNEKSTMIIDLTDSTGVQIGQFLTAKEREDDGARLLNVALSRARDHVVLVGNFRYLHKNLSPHSLLSKVIQHFMEYGQAIDPLSPHLLAEGDWVKGMPNTGSVIFQFPEDASAHFDERSFYTAFARDIRLATKSVTVFSPFMTEQAAGRWADHFRALIQRGVKVVIYTRSLAEYKGIDTSSVGELFEAYRRMGVTMRNRNKMHEKIAIIDDSVIWQGSLNILAHTNTTETMLRILSPALCQQILRNFGADTIPT